MESVLVKGAARRFLPPASEPMELTSRDVAVVQWVHEAGLATREHIQALFFTPASRTRCQRRLTLLYRNRYLDKLPRRPVNTPDIYYVSYKASRGLHLLRAMNPERSIKPRSIARTKIDHSLEIAHCHVALTKACKAAGYKLSMWLGEEELAAKMQSTGILPDAYFQIARPSNGGERRAGFFLEVERSNKSDRMLREKFKSYGEFYYHGQYEERFGVRALRILVVFGSDYGMKPERQIARALSFCEQEKVTIVRFTPLEKFLQLEHSKLLSDNIWHQPRHEELVSLF